MLISYFVVAGWNAYGRPESYGLVQRHEPGDFVVTWQPSECEWYVPGTI